eukprot:gene9975-biopygen7404
MELLDPVLVEMVLLNPVLVEMELLDPVFAETELLDAVRKVGPISVGMSSKHLHNYTNSEAGSETLQCHGKHCDQQNCLGEHEFWLWECFVWQVRFC